MGRLELDFGGIDCEFGGLSPLATPNAVDLGGLSPLLLNSAITCFNNVVYCSGIDVFSSHQQSSVEICDSKHLIENLPLLVAYFRAICFKAQCESIIRL